MIANSRNKCSLQISLKDKSLDFSTLHTSSSSPLKAGPFVFLMVSKKFGYTGSYTTKFSSLRLFFEQSRKSFKLNTSVPLSLWGPKSPSVATSVEYWTSQLPQESFSFLYRLILLPSVFLFSPYSSAIAVQAMPSSFSLITVSSSPDTIHDVQLSVHSYWLVSVSIFFASSLPAGRFRFSILQVALLLQRSPLVKN